MVSVSDTASHVLAIIIVLFPLALLGVLGLAGVVLVHEAVHALDWARWGWVAHRKTLKTGDELQAFSAVAEGHAQLVAEDAGTAAVVGDGDNGVDIACDAL